MINKVIEFSAKNRMVIFIITSALVFWGLWSMYHIPLDAIPDLSDAQVIVFTEWQGRSPDLVEDQVTYPIVSAFISAPRVTAVRGFSDLGVSYVYVIFEEGTDIYWARSRVLEYLQGIRGKLPEGINPTLGPDASGAGWVYEYALVDETGQRSLADLRAIQDWNLRYALASVPGVSEVAAIGGFVKQYQVQINPTKLAAYRIPLKTVVENIQRSNNDVEGRVLEFWGREYAVRGRGYIKNIADIENIVVGNDGNGTPVLVRDVGRVALGPDLRRGVAELNGKGEVVGGIIVMRFNENALNVIGRVKERLHEVEKSLPPGVKIVTTYDRSDLIRRAIDTLRQTLGQELIIVCSVILIFLWHIPSAIIPILTIPIAAIIAFVPLKLSGITSNIMSLGGIAIAIGAMDDAAIVVVEQTHKKLEQWDAEGKKRDYQRVVVEAIKEVGGPSFYSLLVIAVSFLPVFALEAQEGRMFKPLAYTKNFAMAIAAVLAITLDPAIRLLFTHAQRFSFRPRWLCAVTNTVLVGKIRPEEKHPISRVLIGLYQPVAEFALRFRWVVLLGAAAVIAITVPIYFRLGSEFMPPLNEGSILYMPTALPGLSVREGSRLIEIQDRVLVTFPEVQTVFGTIGRADTATDNSPIGMVNTIVVLKPEGQWRPGMTFEKLVAEMDRALQIPGIPNVWTMPIRGRIDMLLTGIKTPVGIKILGPDLKVIQQVGEEVERVVKEIPGTSSAYAERVAEGYFTDIRVDRIQAARYGLTVGDIEDVISTAIGGEEVTRTIEGRERYPVNVRYAQDFRNSLDGLRRVLVATPGGAQIPLGQVASVELTTGPTMIRDENGMLASYVYIDMNGRDLGDYVKNLRAAVDSKLKIPHGYRLEWTGQFEAKQRAEKRLAIVIPLTLLIVILLLYFNTRSAVKTTIVLLAVPFSAVGAIWLLYLLHYNLSVAVWVGLIALLGVDAETGVFMLVYLDLAYHEWQKKGQLRSWEDLKQAILYGAVKRVRPKFMSVATTFVGLLPIMWSTGTGADVMKRIAAPLVGGLFTSFIMELVVYPVIYAIWKWNFEVKPSLSGKTVPETA